MKKIFFLLCFVSLTLLGACNKSDNQEQHDFSKTVGLLFYEPTNDWRHASVVYGTQAANQLGLQYDLKLSDTAAEQEKALNEMMAKGIRTFVVCSQGMNASVVNKAIEQGAQVVLFDNEIQCNYAAYVSGNHEDMGKLAGEHLRKQGVRKVVAFEVTSTSGISTPRMEALRKALGNDIPVEVIPIEAYTPEAGKKVLNQLVASDADAFWAQDDQILMGIFEDVKTKAPQIRYIASGAAYQPFLQVMKEDASGIDLSTVTFSPENIKTCIEIAANLTKGLKPEQKRIVTPSELVTLSNVDKFIKEGVKF